MSDETRFLVTAVFNALPAVMHLANCRHKAGKEGENSEAFSAAVWWLCTASWGLHWAFAVAGGGHG